MGMTGWGLDLMVRAIEQYGRKAKPDVVVLDVGPFRHGAVSSALLRRLGTPRLTVLPPRGQRLAARLRAKQRSLGLAMIRLFFRFLGMLLLAAAFAALIIDGTKSIAANAVIYTPTADTAAQVFPDKFKLLQPALEGIHPLLWNPAMTSILRLPVAGDRG